MKKTIFFLQALFLIIALLAVPILAAETATILPDEVWVDDDFNPATPGWGITHFDSLQTGVNAVAMGGTVYVAAGNYKAATITTSTIMIMGDSGAILDGSNDFSNSAGLQINAANVALSGLTFNNWNYINSSVAISIAETLADSTIISSCLFYQNRIDIESSSSHNLISGNTSSDALLHSMIIIGNGNQLLSNNIAGSGYSGIYVEGNTNYLFGNTVTAANRVNIPGEWLGAITVQGDGNEIESNTADNNHQIGIFLKGDFNSITDNHASDNGFSGGWRGIHLYGSSNEILGNTVTGNNSAGIETSTSNEYPSSNNVFVGNRVENNRDSGFYLWGMANTVSDNQVSENGQSGIQIVTGNSGSTISGNVCEYNGDYGIDSRGGNLIISNTVRYNEREDSELYGGGINAGEGDVVHFNSIYGNNPYGLLTWLGYEAGGSVAADFEPIDAANNWWGHPDGPTLKEPAIPTAMADAGDAVAGLLTYAPWLSHLSLTTGSETLTVGKDETVTISLINSEGDIVGTGALSVQITVLGDPIHQETLPLIDGQAHFTYRRAAVGTDTIRVELLVAGENTGMESEHPVTWAEGSGDSDDPQEELPDTGADVWPSVTGLLLLGLGQFIRKKR